MAISSYLKVGLAKLELLSDKSLESDAFFIYIYFFKKDLLSVSLLIQLAHKVLFASNKFVITRHSTFVCIGYFIGNTLFKLNVITFRVDNVVNISLFVSNVKSSNPQYGRVSHLNLQSIRCMTDLGLMPESFVSVKEKCQVCVYAKQHRKSFKLWEEKSSCLN